jgi:hypothetical protein
LPEYFYPDGKYNAFKNTTFKLSIFYRRKDFLYVYFTDAKTFLIEGEKAAHSSPLKNNLTA